MLIKRKSKTWNTNKHLKRKLWPSCRKLLRHRIKPWCSNSKWCSNNLWCKCISLIQWWTLIFSNSKWCKIRCYSNQVRNSNRECSHQISWICLQCLKDHHSKKRVNLKCSNFNQQISFKIKWFLTIRFNLQSLTTCNHLL
jgi:hypothetical protein